MVVIGLPCELPYAVGVRRTRHNLLHAVRKAKQKGTTLGVLSNVLYVEGRSFALSHPQALSCQNWCDVLVGQWIREMGQLTSRSHHKRTVRITSQKTRAGFGGGL